MNEDKKIIKSGESAELNNENGRSYEVGYNTNKNTQGKVIKEVTIDLNDPSNSNDIKVEFSSSNSPVKKTTTASTDSSNVSPQVKQTDTVAPDTLPDVPNNTSSSENSSDANNDDVSKSSSNDSVNNDNVNSLSTDNSSNNYVPENKQEDKTEQSNNNLPSENQQNNSDNNENLPDGTMPDDDNQLTEQEKRDQAAMDYFKNKQDENRDNLHAPNDHNDDLGEEDKNNIQNLNDKTTEARTNPREGDDLAKKDGDQESNDGKNSKTGEGSENSDSKKNSDDPNKPKDSNNKDNKQDNLNKNNQNNPNKKGTDNNKNNNNSNKNPQNKGNSKSRIPENMRRKGNDPRESFNPRNSLDKFRNNLKNRLNPFKKNDDKTEKTSGSASGEKVLKVVQFIMRNPWILIVLFVIIFIFGILMILFAVFGSGSAASGGYLLQQETQYEAPNFTSASFTILNADNTVIESNLTIDEYVIGMAMLDIDISKATNDQIQAYMILAKTKLLASVNYSDTNNVYYVTTGQSGIEYCNPSYGCAEYSDGTNKYYYSKNMLNDITTYGTPTGNTYEPMSSDNYDALSTLYYNTSYRVLLPGDSTEISSFSASTYSIDLLSSNVINKIMSSSGSYEDIIGNVSELSSFDVVDGQAYIETYMAVGCGNSEWWWPSGSDKCTTENGVTMCTGKPSQTGMSAGFPKYNSGGAHKGIDITNQDGTAAVTPVIAAAGGTVLSTGNNCEIGSKRCNSGMGNYVKIDHGGGYVSIYMHMRKGSVLVSKGDTVLQGQKIGEIGLTGNTTGYHLHFQVELNEVPIQPLTKVNPDNPRQGECKEAVGGMSLNKTSLSQSQFKQKMEDYCKSSGNSNFCNNFSSQADTIYTVSVSNNVNPELVVVTAGTEQSWNSHGTNNYWGINVTNNTSSINTGYSSLSEGIKAYATLINKYSSSTSSFYKMIQNTNATREKAGCKASGHGAPGTLAGMQSIYSSVGVCRLNPGNSGAGGCYYLNIIYGSGYCSTKPTCTSYSNYSSDSKTTVCEQNDYTAYQIEDKIKMRNRIFG